MKPPHAPSENPPQTQIKLLCPSNKAIERPVLLHTNQPKMKGLSIDFLAYDREMIKGSGGRKVLLQAVGKKGNESLSVLDATAGLARDAFFMAKFGCTLTLIERSPPLLTLLHHAIEEAAQHPHLPTLKLISGDAIQLIPTLLPRFDVIYLDPMFHLPASQSKAKVKKDLQILQSLHEEEPDDGVELLAQARQFAGMRVVVKRSQRADYLGGQHPSWSLKTKSLRFDIYQVNSSSISFKNR